MPGTGRDDQRGGQQMSSMSTGSDHETGEVDIGSDCDDIELPPESQAVSSGNDQPITEVENNANLEPKTSANISDDGLHTADTNRVSDAAVNMDSPSDIASAPDSGPSLRVGGQLISLASRLFSADGGRALQFLRCQAA